MTIEQIELQKMLTQMLADNGINRETIVDFVKSIVEEKVEKAIYRTVHELILTVWFVELYGKPQRGLYRRKSLKRYGRLYPQYQLALNAMRCQGKEKLTYYGSRWKALWPSEIGCYARLRQVPGQSKSPE